MQDITQMNPRIMDTGAEVIQNTKTFLVAIFIKEQNTKKKKKRIWLMKRY